MKAQIMNSQMQPHLPKSLEAVKLYKYLGSSYGRIAHHLKVSKSTVFYWVQSFILCVQITFLFPAKCSGTIGFDAKWVKVTKALSKSSQKLSMPSASFIYCRLLKDILEKSLAKTIRRIKRYGP